MPSSSDIDTHPSFLTGGGELGRRIREFDWSDSTLGRPESWPPALQTVIGILLGSQQPMFVAWGDQHTLLYNTAYARILGDKHPAALGAPFLETFAEIRDDLVPIVEQAYAGHAVHMDDITLVIDRHGYPEETHFAFSYTPIRSENGEVAGFFCPCVETTAHVLAERHRAAESARQRRLFDQAPGFIAILRSPEHLFEFTNAAYLRLSGGRDLRGKSVREAFPELEGQGFHELLDQVYRSGERFLTFSMPILLNYSPGNPPEERFLDFIYEPVINEANQVTGIFVQGHDVTDKLRAQQALCDLNETLERRIAARTIERDRVWRNSRDILVIIDSEGIFRAVNPAWSEVLGHAQDEVEGQPVDAFIWPDDLALTQAGLARAISNDLINFENRFRHKDGTPRWVSWHTSFEGDLLYAYGRHITAEKRQAQALREAEEQLRQAQKMEAVGQLTGGIAHDFNNLLTGIIGSLEIMQNRVAKGQLQGIERYMQGAMNSAQRAAALTHRLLAFARRQPLDPKLVDANRLIADMAELIERTLGPLYQLELRTEEALWITQCDPYQLESSILNIAINARDAMPEGGTLTIETANVQQLDNRISTQSGIMPGDYVMIRIADTGRGMSPGVMEHAVEPFFTTKPQGQGTGLGLSMVYGFAKQSEGHLKIDSMLGEGSTVAIYLPRHTGNADVVQAEPEANVPSSTARETVLVVEDEALIRELIVDLLTDLEFDVLQAADGLSGLALLKAQKPIDLLITDIGLPGLNGRQLAEQALVEHPALKVLFITGYAENATLARGFMRPGMEMMTKPFTITALEQKIQGMLQPS
ncbi:PAS domain-containing protein [Pseudomonas borbori]